MNTPPLLLAAAFLFWGWHTGYLAVGATLGILLELPRLTHARWSFTQSDLDRLWNLCVVIFLASAVYLFISEGTLSWNDFVADATRRPDAIREKGRAALLWFQWFPMLLFPFAAAVAWGEEASVGISTFSWFLRRRRAGDGRESHRVNIGFVYFALILFATSATNRHTAWFYPLLCLLLGWAFWSQRTNRYSTVQWIGLFAVVAAGGYYSQGGIGRIERAMEEMNVAWLSRLAPANTESKQSRTAIGSIGRLQLSDRIVYRLRTDGQAPPALLREASYTTYRGPDWVIGRSPEAKREISEATNNATWILLPQKKSRRAVTIAGYLRHGNGIIAAPGGVSRLEDLPVEELDHTALGVIRAQNGPGLVIYDAWYDGGAGIDAAPGEEERRVFDAEEPSVAAIAEEIGLRPGMDPRRAVLAVQAFFARNFAYTTRLSAPAGRRSNPTALGWFLTKQRAGHCEYFATAATLLLRKAGLPTRYAIGYSVQEGAGKKFLVRERHGHAWTLVYYDGVWHDVDTTPSSWNAAEQGGSWTRPFRDLCSNVWFQFSKWRWGSTEWRRYIIWVPVPLVALALATFFLKKQGRRMRRRHHAARSLVWPGQDSEFYAVERQFGDRGLARREGEPVGAWLRRIEVRAHDAGRLRSLAMLHIKYRFDPRGLSDEERMALRDHARTLLKS